MKENNHKKVLVAVAWPYVNGDIHVGHLAGYLLPADIIARYHRMRGNDVLMVSGSDCHGTPITVEADKQGVTSEEIVEKYHKRDVELFNQYKLSYNLYTTTTTANHKKVVQDLFIDLLENGFIKPKKEKQYYSEADNRFLPDRYVEGECPHCHAKEQRSDQCEVCGRMLEQGTLINPYSKLTKAEVTLKETEHYYLDLSELSERLEEYVDEKGKLWRDWIYQEAKGWIKEGLRERAITRDLDWGVEIPAHRVPEDKLIDNIENKRIYVWFEAVTGYLSAPQEWSSYAKASEDKSEELSDKIYKYFEGQSTNWEDWWLDSTDTDKKHYYFLGQDNVVFHTILWQGQLIGAQKDYHLPDVVAANKFMNYEGKKFSKSRNWIIDSKEIADEFGLDQVRYYIAANLPENKQGNFTWESFEAAVNNELVANLGNLVNRTLTFAERNFGGEVKGSIDDLKNERYKNAKINNSDDNNEEFWAMNPYQAINIIFGETEINFEKVDIVQAMGKIMKLGSYGNTYFNDSKIWNVIKEDNEKAEKIMFNLLHIVLNIGILLAPILPDASNKILKMLGLRFNAGALNQPQVGKKNWKFQFSDKFEIGDVELLFEKIDVSHKIKEAKKSNIEALLGEIILAKVVKFKKHPNADRLNIATVSDGEKEYVVVTGADNVSVGDIVPYLAVGKVLPGPFLHKDKKITLELKDLRGVISQGMILAEDEIGTGDSHERVVVYDIGDEKIGGSILEVMGEGEVEEILSKLDN